MTVYYGHLGNSFKVQLSIHFLVPKGKPTDHDGGSINMDANDRNLVGQTCLEPNDNVEPLDASVRETRMVDSGVPENSAAGITDGEIFLSNRCSELTLYVAKVIMGISL